MTFPTIEELQEEIEHLRVLVASLSATLLRTAALESLEDHQAAGQSTVEHLVREAEECFRYARIAGLKREVALGLEAAGNELLSKAVAIETRLQRETKKN